MAGKMQATYNGVSLDNGSYRRIWGSYGDDIGFDGRRIVAVDFSVTGATPEQAQQYKREVEDAFTVSNGRFTLTLDDTAGTLYADISPGDGKHTSTACKVGINSSQAQTGCVIEMRLVCIAEVAIPTSHPAGSSTPNFTGLIGNLTYGHDYSAARIQSYRLQAAFTTTFDDDANGPYSIASVASAGGKAKFTLSTDPVAFATGQRLKVTAGTAYLGTHLITAIDIPTKTVTTDTAYTATATGTAYIGTVTTGQANYAAARNTLLTDYMHVDTDGSRDTTGSATGMVLKTEAIETINLDGTDIQVVLISGFMERELSSTPEARGFELTIQSELPERWSKDGGIRPVYLIVRGSVPISRDALTNAHIYSVWERGLHAEIMTIVRQNSGETDIRPLMEVFDTSEVDGRLTFNCRYQARNTTNIAYTVTTVSDEEDDRMRAVTSKGEHYDQRPPGPKPKTVTVTATRVGVGNQPPTIPVPTDAGAGAFYDPSKTVDTVSPYDGQFADDMVTFTRSTVFLRTVYAGGNGGSNNWNDGGIGNVFNQDLSDAQSSSQFADNFNRGTQF